MGHHNARTDLGREVGATDIISARREEGIAQVRELIGGHGTHLVLEAVGTMPADEQAVGIVRPGGVTPAKRTAGVGTTSDFGQDDNRDDFALRDQVDLDSMDWLNFLVGIHKRLRVTIPESDYASLRTLTDVVRYIERYAVQRH